MADKYTMRRYDLLGSMKQSTNPFLMDESEFTYLKNITYDEVGSLSKDGGYSQYGGNLSASGKIDKVFDYIDSSGGHTLIAVNDGDVYKADDTPTWTEIGTATFTADSKVSMINYLSTCYMASGDDGIFYTSGSTPISINGDNGDSEIKGKYLATLDNSLFVGHMTDVYNTNQVVYTGPGGHVFYNPSEDGKDTYETTGFILTVDGAITGLYAFQGLLYIFTEDAVWYYNPETNGVKQLAGIGTPSHETIKEINGVLYWANRDGVFRYNGSNMPELISLPITNWAINSLWRAIDGSNWGDTAAIGFEGKYFLSVGDLAAILPGDDAAQEGVVFVYDTYRDTWSFLTNHSVSTWTRYVNSAGNQRLLFGSNVSPKVYQKDYTYLHDGSAIEMVIRTKYFHFDNPESEKTFDNLIATYRPQGEDGAYITIKTATNGTNNYETIVDGSSSSRLELDGVLGMEFQQERVTLKGLRGRSLSYEFSNADGGVNMTLLGFAQDFTYGNTNMNISY